jgi:alpha-tubulin suppressor-like RCC1 family protein
MVRAHRIALPVAALLTLSACERDPTGTDLAPIDPVFGVLSAGEAHTCAVAADGTGYCWGLNSSGRLGVGDYESRAVPTPIAGGHRFRQVSTSFHHSCGVTVDGTVYCWGSSSSGQVGIPNRDECGTSGGRVPSGIQCVLTPVAAAPDIEFSWVGTGMMHTCALAVDGRAYCWGSNTWGQIGDGSDQPSMTPVAVAGSHRFASLAVGPRHTCGLTADGRAYCWGVGEEGQLGIGAALRQDEFRAVPTEVSGGVTFERLDAAYSQTCGITTGGAAYCWGRVATADGEPANHLAPAALDLPGAVVAISGSDNHTCAVGRDGTLYCWGANSYGELAQPVSAIRAPAPVAAPRRFRGVSVGSGHSCGVVDSGEVVCWGQGIYGQLGDGSGSNTHVPVVALEQGAIG